MSAILNPPYHKLQQDVTGNARVRKVRSHAALLSTVGDLARHPAASLGRLASGLYARQPPRDQELENRRAVLYHNLRSASTYTAWRDAAVELDDIEGNNPWKHDLETDEYDYKLVKARLEDLDDARLSCDPKRMLFLIRTALTRHIGGMGSVHLYKHSHIGTKVLIEKYIESALDTISTLIDATRRPTSSGLALDSRHLLEQILAARQAFGRSALLLSGGGTFGMNHIGVVKALWEARFLPRIISGASAGSIVAGVLCTRTDDELPAVIDEFCYGDLDVFTKDPSEESLTSQVIRFLKHGSLFDISNLRRVMQALLGDMTFQEAYNRTRRILNICVSSAGVYELPRLLNYITAPNVIIWSAVQSSCSVPLVFNSSPLLAKDLRTGEPYDWNPSTQPSIDGSVDNDLPMTRLAELFNVNHFIVSQVNPHVVPFLDRDEDALMPGGRNVQDAQYAGPGWLHTVADIARGEAMHRMQVLADLGIFPTLLTKTMSILSQRYSGDITILPEVPFSQFPKVLKNPTTEFMVQASLTGERATWPKLGRIQNHCAIELALDDAVQQLRARIAFSPSQVDLRLHIANQTLGRASNTEQRVGNHENRKRLRYMHASKSFHNIDTSMSQGSGIPPMPAPGPPQPSMSFNLSFKPSSPDPKPSSEEEKMFSTSPNESSTEDGDDEDEDTDNPGDDYFSRSIQPQADVMPTLWPSTRQLFPYSSQPSTPQASFKTPSIPQRTSPVSTAHPHLTMTPTSHHSSLNTTKNSQSSSNRAPMYPISGSPHEHALPPRPPTPHASHARLAIDMSGTRGLVLRKRRSLSSGRPTTPGH